MADGSRTNTSVDKGVLTRLIAAARIAGPVSWHQAEADARQDIAHLWGDPTPNGRVSHVDVSTEVLLQLAAAAAASVAAAGSRHTGGDWAVQVAGDLLDVQDLTGPAGGRAALTGRPR